MPQALHIFTKDVRRLRWEILVVLALAAAFVGAEVRRDQTDTLFNSTVLLPLAWIYLIARVIHAEALSGHKQFWLTRPYSWKSLLAAKALFVLAFVTLPMLIADVAIVAAEGFNPGSHLSGLLWEQLLWWLVFIIPTVVLAAVTTGLVEFVSWLLLLVGSLYVIGMNQRPNWAAWRWPHFTLDTVVLGSCAVIVVWQYARRRTAIAQAVIAGIFVAEALVFCFPDRVGFAVLAGLSKTQIDGSRLRLTFNPSRTTVVHDREGRARIALSLRIDGAPQSLQIREDGVRASIESSSGRTLWRSTDAQLLDWFFELEPGTALQFMDVDGALYDRLKDQPVRIRTSALFTLYGNQRTVTLPRTGSVEVPGVGTCDMKTSQCRSPFRGPRVLVSTSGFATQARYAPPSPYPAELTITPIIPFSISNMGWPSGVLMTEEPVAHLRSDFEIGPIRLANFDVAQR
jgi:hypothetical protein